MGRCFSTAYRLVVLSTSVAAVVLSVLAATSCQFVQFDHQYKGSRFLFGYYDENEAGMTRALQDTEEGEDVTDPLPLDLEDLDLPEDSTLEDLLPEDSTLEDLLPEDLPEDSTLEDVTSSEPADVTPAAAPADATALDAAAETAAELANAPADETVADPVEAPLEDSETAPGLGDVAGTEAAAEAPAVDDPTPAATPVVDDPVPVSTPADTTPVSTPADDLDPTPVSTPADDLDPTFDEDETMTSSTAFSDEPEDTTPPLGPMNGQGSSELDEQDSGAFGSAAEDYNEAAAAEPIATASGDAGLFCEGEQSFSITNLWKGSIQDLEEDIVAESEGNQSEELARGAALAASVFGILGSVILILEMTMGFRLCCDRWIVGLISLSACVCQGVTFLFFNSERYCDGDIVNEILNQEPCVMGQGGWFSVIAIVLYAIMIPLSCRLPQDDPYGLCCNNNKDEAPKTFEGGSGQFGLLGGKKESMGSDGDGNTARSGQERERPNWMSEENEAKDEENEII